MPLPLDGLVDRFLYGLDNALATLSGRPEMRRPDPAAGIPEATLNKVERDASVGLMRINHTGEICAQGLYLGQAALTREPAIRTHLMSAAREEADHLAWCESRLRALDARPSLLNPLWYTGSYIFGALSALAGDALSLGFVSETERQVEAHLEEHLRRLPATDTASRAVVARMREDEARHGAEARAAGAQELPWPWPDLMRATAGVMKAIAYRI